MQSAPLDLMRLARQFTLISEDNNINIMSNRQTKAYLSMLQKPSDFDLADGACLCSFYLLPSHHQLGILLDGKIDTDLEVYSQKE